MTHSLPGYLQEQAFRFRLEKIRRQTSPQFPIPYARQSEILLDTSSRKVVASGRQVGKTMTASMSAIGGKEYGGRGLMDGAYVHLSSTSQDQSDLFWDYITHHLKDYINTPGFYKNESKRLIRFRGGQIRVKTGRNPDALRGGNVDKLILDECAYLDPDAWRKVGMPMLVARDGVAEFYSTPKRRNWFFELYNQAIGDTSGRWHGWNFSTLENPHLPQSALDALMADMTDEDYKQEILAQFLEGEGAVFRHITERATLTVLNPGSYPACCRLPYEGHFVFGIDWAQKSDSTVVCVLDKDTLELVAMDRFNGVDWSLQRGRVRALYDAWKPGVIFAEENSIGSPNIEALQAEGLPVRAFMTTAQSKPPLIESLVLAFDRGEITVLNDNVLKGELMAYERKVGTTGRSQYSAPEGMHDDTVIALALALHGCLSGRLGLPIFMD